MKIGYCIFSLVLFFLLFGGLPTVSAQQAGGPPPGPPPGPPFPGSFRPGAAPQRSSPSNIMPAAISEVPVEINFDFANSRGEYSKYIFTVGDDPIEEAFKLIKEGNFQAVSIIQFLKHPQVSEDKARMLSKYNLEGVIYWEVEADRYLPEEALKRKIDQMLNRINELTQKYPNLKIKIFLFGNEPDFPRPPGHWRGTQEQFFQNYATFYYYLKSKNKNYVVGGGGFTPESELGGKPSEWPEKFLKYLYEHNIPIDFISFHAYGSHVKAAFTDMMTYYNNLLQRYPVRSPIFGTPKIANNEFDLLAHPLPGDYSLQMDTTWRAAHNIMGLMAMVHEGIWFAAEFAGPFRIMDPFQTDVDFLWVKKNGTIKPVYYAHKAFNALAGTIQIAQQGSNFETFGALAGKSRDANSVTIVLANYDEYGYRHVYHHPGPEPNKPRQSVNAKVYREYKINLKNLPWGQADKIQVERFIVDDNHQLSLVESTVIQGDRALSIMRPTGTPEVQLIRIKKP
jgi:hypothetical protein